MTLTTLPAPLISHGCQVDTSPTAFGELKASMDVIDDAPALRQRMREDGYLFLPGYLDRAEVLDARREMTGRLGAEGHLDLDFPLMQAVAAQTDVKFKPDLAHDNAPLSKVLYNGRMMEFYERLLGGPVRHFDFTWIRAVSPGLGTAPHCDIVFMGRGTQNLLTAWTPLGDIDLEMGGLMVLEGSHQVERLKNNYGRKDVDAFCTNRRGEDWTQMGGGGNIRQGGALSHNPVKLRERLGGRWLTAEFRAGDLLTFSMFTVHCSLDNQSNRIRLSSDTRYQLASEPADERWIGPKPIGHGAAAKRGMIC